MRHITQNGLQIIKDFEGYSRCVYNEAQAEAILIQDVKVAENAVSRLIDVPLTDNQFDALVSFTFNLGSGSLQASTLRMKINRGEHGAAPYEFRRWVYCKGQKLNGLVRRREYEASLYSQT
jgi:lysozyme